MKLVVTGALGHIGSRFIRALRPGDWSEVVLLDNLSTQRYVSLFDLPAAIPYRFCEEDILTADLKRHIEGAYAVVHLAAIADPGRALADPEGVERINHEGTARVARACAAAGARLFFPSSTSVYGDLGAPGDRAAPSSRCEGGPVVTRVADETLDPDALRPRGPYAEGKLRTERLLAGLARTDGLRYNVARFGTIFGVSPGMRFHTAVNRFTWQACTGLPLTVWRTALHQVRPYLDVADAAAAIGLFLKRDLFDGDVWNVVTTEVTVDDVVALLRRHVPELEVNLVDSPLMTEASYTVSTRKLRAAGFESSGSLELGIAETVARLKGLRAAREP